MSLAVSTKLLLTADPNIMCNAHISDLYEYTLSQQVDFSLWPQWIQEQLKLMTVPKDVSKIKETPMSIM